MRLLRIRIKWMDGGTVVREINHYVLLNKRLKALLIYLCITK